MTPEPKMKIRNTDIDLFMQQEAVMRKDAVELIKAQISDVPHLNQLVAPTAQLPQKPTKDETKKPKE